jgi:hypothetical protein
VDIGLQKVFRSGERCGGIHGRGGGRHWKFSQNRAELPRLPWSWSIAHANSNGFDKIYQTSK